MMQPRVDVKMGDAAEIKESRRTFIVPSIKSMDHYDFSRAKISCSLTWLIAKAFGSDCVPVELEDPFYRDQYDQEHVKPPVVSLLLSAELYCRAGSLILRSDAAKPLLGHNAVIQALAQKALYVTDQERLVTERDLCKTPIQMSSHLAMIDTLMMAYTVEMVSVERVLSCIQKFTPFLPEEDFPYDAEEAVTTWINKVNEHLRELLTQEQRGPDIGETCAVQKGRYRKDDSKIRSALCVPLVDSLMKDNTDGCALGALLHFYCPDAVPLEDVCIKETMSLADSLYNLQLIQEFCRENLNNCCHFTLEDMLYASSTIKSNYLVFMAELFWWCEVVKPSFVQPRTVNTKASDSSQSNKMAPITKQNLIHRPGSPEQSRSQPNNDSSAVIRRSSSMSYVDGCVGTWPKEKRSSAHGISFEIPLDDRTSSSSGRGLSRSVSTEGLGFKVHHAARGMRRNLSFQPVNGNAHSKIHEEDGEDSNRPISRHRLGTYTGYTNGVSTGNPSPPYDAQPSTPSIEEALKIIHDSERPQSSLPPPSGDSAFFLHNPSSSNSASDPNEPEDSLNKARADDADLNSTSTDMDTGIHVRTEDIQDGQDEDSSLKDYSDMDQDYEARSCPLPDTSGNPCPSLLGTRSLATSMASSLGSAIRMTSFAEQKFRKLNHGDGRSSGSGGNTPETAELNATTPGAYGTVRSVTPDTHSPARITSPRDPSHLLASEMVQLKMKLEEKRRAIEAQKKKVEAAFTRHRQRMGRTAFLNVVRRKGVVSPLGGSSEGPDGREKTTNDPEPQKSPLTLNDSNARLERCRPDGAPPKSPLEDAGVEVDLTEYTRSIERLNTSLGFLQSEMQRLAQQQERIMQMREHQSWVISPPDPSPRKQFRELRSSSVVGRGSVGSLSPILSSTGSPRTTHRSPSTIKRKSASFHARTPRTPRPNDLKVTSFSRMLNTPQSVDSLPRLRRVLPSQPQISSFAYLGSDERALSKEQSDKEKPCKPESKDTAADQMSEKQKEEKRGAGESDKLTKALTSEVTASGNTNEEESEESKDLIEVPLSVLKPLDGHELESSRETETGLGSKPDQKMCCGFFYKDDLQGEEDIAQKKAALMEKRLRREKEMQIKKQQQEAEIEQKKEAARMKVEEERQKKEDEKARREYIKHEHMRRKQLKLMEDMDSVIKPSPSGAKQKKPRPKSMHRDIMESPKPPARTATGSRPRGYSVSSISLASLNLADNESIQSDKRTSRGSRLSPGSLCFFLSSPKGRKGRPESAEGFLSPCPSVSGNGENWELESTSSAASNTEYTGPKLYKEPSAKSNKYIIQNALAHCCLAGRVNEGQKNKILEEMEKTEANNFLILFRDTGCQFRSLYTYYPEAEEMNKLAGIGPKTITPKMIENLYKYSSDKKQFSKIPAKTMSASVDAITIYSHLWQNKKQNTAKKLLK
ncbi:calmodulin-regulated spectrin-associated protein 2 isoform X1 [Danio rerio]|uniref:Calmodulin-regulated spectrin-associated protein 2 isoform X1 n=1 Tax=Danio rerio TaxID=7955 RepID=A0AC58HVF8_DANRE|nr:calmodulin-regulated spectrin-associated protein 2-like isoform X4 [Danio rerio]|eukprot:XP_021326962.1 calmodulin-regulated spectrin-associated protein 2-like isoform X4 [Danio rerio]